MQGTKNKKSKILSFGWVFDVIKWLKRWEIKDLVELLGDDRKYEVCGH